MYVVNVGNGVSAGMDKAGPSVDRAVECRVKLGLKNLVSARSSPAIGEKLGVM